MRRAVVELVKPIIQVRVQTLSYSTVFEVKSPNQHDRNRVSLDNDRFNSVRTLNYPEKDVRLNNAKNVPKRDKVVILVNTLFDLEDNKEAVYGAFDAWAAWEQEFPIGTVKKALLTLEQDQQWHRVVQVIKWMLSKGQGTTMGTYGQLIRALDMDHRAKEAHEIWVKKISRDLHSVPWQLCKLMISVYFRNNMLDDLVNLFKEMEAFDRKLYEKSVLLKIADSFEMLGLPEEKDRVLEKYKALLDETSKHMPNLLQRITRTYNPMC